MNYKSALICSFFILLISSCDPLVTEFSSKESAKEYTAKTLVSPPHKDTLTVVTWNIRFGIGRAKWFGDSCGDLCVIKQMDITRMTEKEKRNALMEAKILKNFDLAITLTSLSSEKYKRREKEDFV